MTRTETIEKILFGRAEENRPGLIERHNNNERMTAGIQRSLRQLVTAVVGATVVALLNLVVSGKNAQKLDSAAILHQAEPEQPRQPPPK